MILWLRGAPFQEQDVELPAWITAMDFETNVTRRETVIEAAKKQLRINYWRAIIKCKFDYYITIDLPSDPDGRPFQISPEIFTLNQFKKT